MDLDVNYYINEIERAKFGDEQSTLNLLDCFNPILRKYAYLLSYDDAYADLRCEFIGLIRSFPVGNYFENNGAVIGYIQKSIFHSYIRLSKKKAVDKAATFFNELSHQQSEMMS